MTAKGRVFRALVVGSVATGLGSPAAAMAQQRITCPAPEGIVGDLVHPFAAVRYLSDDLLAGRLSGTVEERCTAEYVAREFARIGLAPGGTGGGFLQAVPLQSVINPHAPVGKGMNVIGVLPGSDPVLRSEAVVVGAHHDHLGTGEFFGSLADPSEPPAIHNGADDNASGVGAVLALAERLAAGTPPARSVVFVTFSGEEFGLLGSSQFVQAPPIPLDRTIAMVNLDMVGRLGEGPLIVNGTGTAVEWGAILDSLEAAAGIPLARSPDGFGPSDQTSFYARDIPALHLFTNVHGEYHRPSDDWELVDRVGLERVVTFLQGLVLAVANRPASITHVAGAGSPPGDVPGGYGAYLGTVPDFAPVEYGVKLSGVSGESPAERAGMRAGDILVRLGEYEISDLYALTDALRALAPGTEVEVTYLREGEEIRMRVVLGER
ncbi:MAG: M28 family peptidase [Gemmatimonadota bacterium]